MLDQYDRLVVGQFEGFPPTIRWATVRRALSSVISWVARR